MKNISVTKVNCSADNCVNVNANIFDEMNSMRKAWALPFISQNLLSFANAELGMHIEALAATSLPPQA